LYNTFLTEREIALPPVNLHFIHPKDISLHSIHGREALHKPLLIPNEKIPWIHTF
jgi:hypothetical protein